MNVLSVTPSLNRASSVKHMNEGLDQHLEVRGQALLTQLGEREDALRDAAAVEAAAVWLMNFCERAGLSPDTSLRLALLEVESANRTLAEARVQLDALNDEVHALERQGLSIARWEEIVARLRELQYPLVEFSAEAAA